MNFKEHLNSRTLNATVKSYACSMYNAIIGNGNEIPGGGQLWCYVKQSIQNDIDSGHYHDAYDITYQYFTGESPYKCKICKP